MRALPLWRCLVLLSLGLSLWAARLHAETLTITAAQAKIYARPDVKTRALATLPRGTSLALVDQRSGWYQVTLADGSPGWLQEAQGKRQATPAGSGSRGLTIRDRQQQPVGLYSASYALVIGVSAYTHWPQLSGVRQDVAAVTALFEAQGFHVDQVTDPTYDELRRAFDTFINTHGQEADHRLLIYFAGHGHTLKPKYGGDMGYIVPRDAPLPRHDATGFRARALPMQDVEAYARRIQSKHVLFLFDSCFSGAIFALNRAATPEYITYQTARPVRQFITSGQEDEEVPDVSIFRQQLVAALRGEADADHDGYVTGAELGLFLQKQVTNYSKNAQHPQYGKLRDPILDKGDFVFSVAAPARPPGPSLAELEAQVQAQRRQVQEEEAQLAKARQLQEEAQRLQAKQEELRLAREQLPSPPTPPRVPERLPPATPAGLAPTLTNSLGVEFVLIQPGTFAMGGNEYDDAKPVHTVQISRAFYLGKYEVTQAQWQQVMGSNPSRFKGATLPVESVSWDEVQQFLAKLNAREPGVRYRLPREAEWEYAARAGTMTAYSFGDDARRLGEYAWYEANAGKTTHPVGQKKPNAWGLHDMHGNVWESVQDWYAADTYAQRAAAGRTAGPAAGSAAGPAAVDPTGPAAGARRVLRGGSWYNGADCCRAGDRFNADPGRRHGDLGLRLLREAP